MNNWIDTANGREGTAYKQGLEEGRREARAELKPVIRELVDIVQRFNDVYEDSNGKPTCDRLAVIALDTRSVLKKHSKSLSPDKGKSGEAATGGE